MRTRSVTALVAALALGAPSAVHAGVATPTPTATSQPSQATPTPTPTPTATPAPARRTKADRRVYRDYAADGVISACRHSVKALRHTLRTITPQFESDFPDFRPAVKAAIAGHRNGGCRPAAPAANTNGGTTSPGSSSTPAPTVAPVATATPGALQPAAPATPAAPAESGRLPGGVPHSGGGARTPQQGLTPSASATPGGPAATEGGITPVVTPTPTPRPLVVERTGGHDLAVPGALLGLAVLVAVLLGLSALAAARSQRLAGVHHAWREAAYRTRGTWRDFSEWLRLGR